MTSRTVPFLTTFLIAALVACGPNARSGDDGDDGLDPPDASDCAPGSAETTPAACGDGIDNDCDGIYDCSDPDCSGVGACPLCGVVDNPLSMALALPDGVGGTTCTTDANCPANQQCYEIPGQENECRASYIATLHYMSFGANQRFVAGNLQSVCVNMEHSWVRDLRIDIVAPSGEIVQLQRMLGQTGGEIYLGMANDCDGGSPTPGTGAMYCFAPSATRPSMLDYANGGGVLNTVPNCFAFTSQEMPPETYSAADPWTNLVGAVMNGDWQLRVIDLWGADNGHIFSWSMTWDVSAVDNCEGPIIE